MKSIIFILTLFAAFSTQAKEMSYEGEANDGYKYKFCYCQWNDAHDVAQLRAIMHDGRKVIVGGSYYSYGMCSEALRVLQGCEEKGT